jgi:TonB family protein
MRYFVISCLIALGLAGLTDVESQSRERLGGKLGIVNGLALTFPEPFYPEAGKRFCADGKVEVAVTINRAGQVIDARALSGDDLLYNAAVDAARRAQFPKMRQQTPRTAGLLVYNFRCPWRCIKVDVPVNSRAVSIPKPDLSHLDNLQSETRVDVDIVVSPEGKVISARTRKGDSLIRAALIRSANGTKFSPTLTGQPVYVRAFIRFVIKPNGDVEY